MQTPPPTAPTLDYQRPGTRPPRRSGGMIALSALNSVSALIGLAYFVPLALHIGSCTEREKWCHMAAFVTGVPSSFLLMILGAASAAWTQAGGRDWRPAVRYAVFVPLGVLAGVLVWLFIAVAFNWPAR